LPLLKFQPSYVHTYMHTYIESRSAVASTRIVIR